MGHSLMTKILLTVGHIYCGLVAISASYIIKVVDYIARIFLSLGENLTGAKNPLPKFPDQRCSTDPVYMVDDKDIIDEEATKQNSTFSIPEDQLIAKAKTFLRTNNGCEQPDLLSDDFLFIFPIVGPLKKEYFIQIFKQFGVFKSMTGSPNYSNFHVDPLEPNRVWFSSRASYKHTGELKFGPTVVQPTGKTILPPPQMYSVSFNDAGQIYKFTGGYCVDKTVGTTDGLGGLFGIMHSLGKTLPFDEGKPLKYSLSWEAFANHFPLIPKIWQ